MLNDADSQARSLQPANSRSIGPSQPPMTGSQPDDIIDGQYVFTDDEPVLPQADKNWFEKLLFETLRRYAENASADYLKNKYPGLPRQVIAERYIRQQAWAAALAGGASAAVVSGAIAFSGLSVISAVGLPALIITIPAGILTFGGEMYYTTRLQIKTAIDLCNLYGLTVSPDDPEDLQTIFALGMGIKAGELVTSLLPKLAPAVAKQQARRFMRTGIRRGIQNWASKNLSRQLARKYLTEGFLLKGVVPILNVALSGGWNYYSTLSIGKAVELRTRLRGLSAERAEKLVLPAGLDPQLALGTALTMMMVDDRASENELVFYRTLAARLARAHPEFAPRELDGRYAEKQVWLAELVELTDAEAKGAVLAIAETMVILDGTIGYREKGLLRQAAIRLGLKLDEARLKQRAQSFYVAPKGRGCMIAVAVVGLATATAACACAFGGYNFISQWLAR